MHRILLILILIVACADSPASTINCNKISGYYTGLLKMGYVEGTASLNVSNDCNFTYTQELNGYDMTTQSGNIIFENQVYIYKWNDNSDYTISHNDRKIHISGYNWSTELEKK